MSLENIEFIIFDIPFVSSSLNASDRALSIFNTAIKVYTLLKTGKTSSDVVFGEQAIWFCTKLTSFI